MIKTLLYLGAALLLSACKGPEVRHTFYSQFSRTDSLQVNEFFSPVGNEVNNVGHHGPAVENQYMALRFYFDGRGAIDVYSKSGKIDNELGRWLWYPSQDAQEKEGAGCDEYYVGKTVGLGGVRLWNGTEEVRLDATAGRRSTVGRTDNGAFMEMISYGVPYQEDTVDVSVRVDVFDNDRWATVTVRSLSGKPLRFATGVNYHPGAEKWQGNCPDRGRPAPRGKGLARIPGDHWVAVWGEHPADVSSHPTPIGGALRYDPSQFPETEDTGNAIRLVSVPLETFTTRIAAASIKEDDLNTPERFFAFVE